MQFLLTKAGGRPLDHRAFLQSSVCSTSLTCDLEMEKIVKNGFRLLAHQNKRYILGKT